MSDRNLPAIHPGEILREEFLGPMEISQYRLALSIGVPPRRISEIVHGKRSISADTALRLGRFFGTSAEFWMNLQAHFDLETQKAPEQEVHGHATACPRIGCCGPESGEAQVTAR